MDISFGQIGKNISHALTRYHVVLFVLVVLGGLGAAILTLNATINLSDQSGDYVSTSNNTSFDAATIDRINKLKSADQNITSIDFKNGRTNPFVE